MDVIRLLFHLFGCFLPFNAEVGSLRYSIRIESVPKDGRSLVSVRYLHTHTQSAAAFLSGI
jgi:hypothetical protein